MLWGKRIQEAKSFRLNLHSSELALVENCFAGPHQPPPSGYEPAYQIVLPYHGLFSYCTGSRAWLLDSTRTLCISPGWEFHEEKPVPGVGHAALLINPSTELVDEICGPRTSEANPAFVQASLPCSPQLQLLTHMLLRHTQGWDEPLCKDEWVVSVLHQLQASRPVRARASKAIARAKEVLHSHSRERLSLDQIAKMVGVSPAYLTQEFTRSEGMPLYKYQMHLRLSRALLELPYCYSITELALDLGFSTHSHFTSLFHRAFGVTPSQYRAGIKLSPSGSRAPVEAIYARAAAEPLHAVS